MRARTRERWLLGAMFGVMPILFTFAVLLPSLRRLDAKRARMAEISRRIEALPLIRPLTGPERALLDDPGAPWRGRIPMIRTDADRFAHYHAVVSGLQAEWKRRKVPLLGVRAHWDVLKGSFTLPGDLGQPELGLPRLETEAKGQLQGWVLDATIGGKPDQLFQAMAALDQVNPLLEPVGLRWESLPEHTRQSLLLRNLILAP
jgi:hypothetical protein